MAHLRLLGVHGLLASVFGLRLGELKEPFSGSGRMTRDRRCLPSGGRAILPVSPAIHGCGCPLKNTESSWSAELR